MSTYLAVAYPPSFPDCSFSRIDLIFYSRSSFASTTSRVIVVFQVVISFPCTWNKWLVRITIHNHIFRIYYGVWNFQIHKTRTELAITLENWFWTSERGAPASSCEEVKKQHKYSQINTHDFTDLKSRLGGSQMCFTNSIYGQNLQKTVCNRIAYFISSHCCEQWLL